MEIQDIPYMELFSHDEIQQLALVAAIRKSGVEDPAEFLRVNIVEFKAAFKQSVGMAITITKVSPRTQTPPKRVNYDNGNE